MTVKKPDPPETEPDDEAPETPTDEPEPEPIQDPPVEVPQVPYVVDSRERRLPNTQPQVYLFQTICMFDGHLLPSPFAFSPSPYLHHPVLPWHAACFLE
jgi:hypothetical protein